MKHLIQIVAAFLVFMVVNVAYGTLIGRSHLDLRWFIIPDTIFYLLEVAAAYVLFRKKLVTAAYTSGVLIVAMYIFQFVVRWPVK